MHISTIESTALSWFNAQVVARLDFQATAILVMSEREYLILWEKLDHKIGAWMEENNKPYSVHYAGNSFDTIHIYFETVEDALLYRMACT